MESKAMQEIVTQQNFSQKCQRNKKTKQFGTINTHNVPDLRDNWRKLR